MDTSTLRDSLKSVRYPGFSRDILSFGLVKQVEYADGHAHVQLEVTTSDPKIAPQLRGEVEQVLNALDGVSTVNVEVIVHAPKGSAAASGSGGQAQGGIPGVKYVVAVASGKGGVGKSTFSVNLACAIDELLRKRDASLQVGLLDCDIYGPSVPLMLGVSSRPEIEGDKIIPPENFGIRCMSMGLLLEDDAPVVWRGPMINQAIQQFAGNVRWGELEVLIVDLPPGTGDAQLSLVQTIPVSGAVVVTTPQAAAVNVARRGARMFAKVNVPILGVAENMSYLVLPDGSHQHIFGEGGGAEVARALETQLLGQVPLDTAIREGGDRGIPIFKAQPQSAASTAFRNIAQQVITKLGST